jgi:hypothetical protein
MRTMVALFAGLVVASPLGAQLVEGGVLLPGGTGGTAGAAGAIVTAVDQSGAILSRTIANDSGAYLLRLDRPGTVRIRAIRLGMTPAFSDSINVESGQHYQLNLTLGRRLVELPAVLASAQSNCNVEGVARARLIQRWQAARTALSRATTDASAGTIHQVLVFDRTQGSIGSREAQQREDPTTAAVLMPQTLFASTPVETLLISGFVRPRGDGRVVFDVPHAAAVLSDGFALTHCLEPRDPKLFGRELVGIDFSPVTDIDTVVDVAGTLWLDPETAEPRRLDFQYTNLRHVETRLRCHPGTLDRCLDATGPHPGNGSLTFSRLLSGQLFVSSWWFQPMSEKAPLRKGFNSKLQDGKWVSCRLSEPGCTRVGVLSIRTTETVGMVMQVASKDRTLYRSEEAAAMAARLASEQSGRWPAGIRGVVTGADGLTRLRAVIEIDYPVRATITDERGFFDFGALPAASVTLSIRADGYQPVSIRLQLIPDSTRSIFARMQPIPK